jgi:hypothetical protein
LATTRPRRTRAQKKLPEKHTSQGGKGRCYLSGSDWTQLRLRAGGCKAGSRMGGAQSPSIGECIVADDGRPCQRQPLRGRRRPIGGETHSTWFVCLLVRESWFVPSRAVQLSPAELHTNRNCGRVAVFLLTHTAACLSCVRRGPGEYGTTNGRSRLICRVLFIRCKQFVTRCEYRSSPPSNKLGAGYPPNRDRCRMVTFCGNPNLRHCDLFARQRQRQRSDFSCRTLPDGTDSPRDALVDRQPRTTKRRRRRL